MPNNLKDIMLRLPEQTKFCHPYTRKVLDVGLLKDYMTPRILTTGSFAMAFYKRNYEKRSMLYHTVRLC